MVPSLPLVHSPPHNTRDIVGISKLVEKVLKDHEKILVKSNSAEASTNVLLPKGARTAPFCMAFENINKETYNQRQNKD